MDPEVISEVIKFADFVRGPGPTASRLDGPGDPAVQPQPPCEIRLWPVSGGRVRRGELPGRLICAVGGQRGLFAAVEYLVVGRALIKVREHRLWFSDQPTDLKLARARCWPCPLRGLCLAGAIERREQYRP